MISGHGQRQSNGGLTLLVNKEGGWASSRGTIGWAHGVHKWVVRIDRQKFVFVGLSLENIDPNGGNHEISYRLHCASGKANGPSLPGMPCLTDVPMGLSVGSLISFRLDMDKKTLTLGLNGKWKDEPTFTDIPSNTWYPFVSLAPGCKVSIVRE
jgi:hypothetical protein